jgi:hypothetical protein
VCKRAPLSGEGVCKRAPLCPTFHTPSPALLHTPSPTFRTPSPTPPPPLSGCVKETCYRGKRDLLKARAVSEEEEGAYSKQKRFQSTFRGEAKETYYRGKRDLQKRQKLFQRRRKGLIQSKSGFSQLLEEV